MRLSSLPASRLPSRLAPVLRAVDAPRREPPPITRIAAPQQGPSGDGRALVAIAPIAAASRDARERAAAGRRAYAAAAGPARAPKLGLKLELRA